jgi:hypothetical protein
MSIGLCLGSLCWPTDSADCPAGTSVGESFLLADCHEAQYFTYSVDTDVTSNTTIFVEPRDSIVLQRTTIP